MVLKMKRWGALAILVAILAPMPSAAADPSAIKAADDALYTRRMADPQFRVGEAYDIMEPIAGARLSASLPVAAEAQLSADAIAKLNAYAQASNSKALLIWKDGAVQDAFYANGGDAETLQKSRSMGKPLGAIAVGLAIQAGAIRSLDQYAVDFIPEWRATPKAKITIRQLLDMTAGFLPQGPIVDPQSPSSRAFLDPHHDNYVILHYPLIAVPGAQYSYAGASADLVGIVVERATHQRYARFISSHLLKMLGAKGGQIWLDREGGLGHTGCCILLPAETWLRVGVLLSQDGIWNAHRLLPPHFVEAMLTPSKTNAHYGLGVFVSGHDPKAADYGWAEITKTRQSEPYLAQDLFLFDGNANQVMYIVPSRKLVILRMGDFPPKAPPWDNAFLANLVLRSLVPHRAGTGG
jgi:CubicO group peptidase (beta-lactamase class C family)